jgi:hypothetical protein
MPGGRGHPPHARVQCQYRVRLSRARISAQVSAVSPILSPHAHHILPQHPPAPYEDAASVSHALVRRYLFYLSTDATSYIRSTSHRADGGPKIVLPRRQAEQWSESSYILLECRAKYLSSVAHNEHTAKRVKATAHHLGEPEGYLMTRQPWQLTWFTVQIAT